MSRFYRLDANGKPVPTSLLEWARWFENSDDERQVALDIIGDVDVSTIFLGYDSRVVRHPCSDARPPVLWETMVFGGALDRYRDRYTSREAALEGHAKAVALVRGDV